jgi:hypothetical protein
MDPNTALLAILRGHMVAEHIEALREWISKGGFFPLVDPPLESAYFREYFLVEFAHKVGANHEGLNFFAKSRSSDELIHITTEAWEIVLQETASADSD